MVFRKYVFIFIKDEKYLLTDATEMAPIFLLLLNKILKTDILVQYVNHF